MSATAQDLQNIALFLRNTLSCFIKGTEQNISFKNLDWRTLQGIVQGRNLSALFSFCHANSPLPPPVIEEWQQAKMFTALQNLAKLKVATDITAIAEKEGIRAVSMRGIVLAQSLYRDPAMRPMHDIDLLIRPADKEKLLAAMQASGYAPTDVFRSQYVYKINNVTVEIHWQLLSNKRYRDKIKSDELILPATKVEIQNGYFYQLNDRWELIGLVVHAFTHHNLSQLFSLIDIGLFMQNKKIDWHDIANRSKEMGISRMMHLTLGFTNHLFSLGLEEKVLDHFQKKNAHVEKYYQAYLDQTLSKITLPTHFGIKRSQFYVAETPANKGREFLRLFSRKELRFFLELITAAVSNKKQKLAS